MLRRILVCLLLLVSTPLLADKQQAAIATAHPLATQAGFEILNQGGNAFDAAVAVSAALAVVEPAGSGLGGGGFWLLHQAEDGYQIMIDGRETAPGAAHRNMYLDENGDFQPTRSLDGPLAAGIPGVPAALDHLSHHYGKLPLSTSLAPAIRYARIGFEVSQRYQRLAEFRLNILQSYAESNAIFLQNGQVPESGFMLKQPALADTLQAIADKGRAGFYRGAIAQKLVESVRKNGGIWTLADLQQYEVKERTPVTGEYQGFKISSAALPSSGGIVLLTILNQLAQFDLNEADNTQQRHWIIEAMRRAYRDRSRYLGDADFVAIPSHLTRPGYGRWLSDSIDDFHASSSTNSESHEAEGENTTHFSIIDQHGNRVAATLSINYPFGSGFVAEGTGVLLNDEMDDFSAQPGTANVYGLIGNEANAIAPHKRPLSSMSPTFVENDERLMITGTPGGSRIISMVLLSVLDFIAGNSAEDIVAGPRFHHQYLPDEVQIENKGFSEAERQALSERGHKIKQLNRQYGDMQVIILDKNEHRLSAASDPRGEGLALVR